MAQEHSAPYCHEEGGQTPLLESPTCGLGVDELPEEPKS